MNAMVLVALPYAAIVIFIAGIVWRRRSLFTISSMSSQMMESRWLAFGSVLFHLGIGLLVIGHAAPLFFADGWQALTSRRTALLTIETLGTAAAVVTLIGLAILLVRRLAYSLVRAGTTVMDVVVLALLIVQIALGLGVATMHRWGAIWSVRTTTPYLWSLLVLRPDPALVAGVPLLVTMHLSLAWLVLALIPFTRLVHMFSIPLGYLVRPPQRVVWTTPRRRRKQHARAQTTSGAPVSPPAQLAASIKRR